MFKALFISGLMVSAGVILGRIAGFVREIILASTFGISAQADMAVLILTVPDLFSSILIGGAMSAAFVPFFRNQSERHGITLWLQACAWIGLCFALLTGLLNLAVLFIITIFAPGMATDLSHFLAGLLQISLWTIPLAALSGLSGAYLQAKDRFFLTASGTLIINGVLITGLLCYAKSPYVLWMLSLASVVGALLRFLAQGGHIFSLRKGRDRLTAADDKKTSISECPLAKLDRRILGRYFEAMAGSSMLMLLPFIARSFASFQGSGAIASFNYAIKLMDLPYAIGLASFGLVLLPKLSDLFKSAHSRKQAVRVAEEGVLMMWILSLSFSIVLCWFARPLIEIVYGWGRLTAENLSAIALLFKWGIWGLPALGLSTLLTATFNAQEDTRTPFLIYLFSFLLFLPLAFLLRKTLSLLGIMFALVAINWFIVILQFYFLQARYTLHLWKSLISLNMVKIMLAHVLVFAPIAWLSCILHGSVWVMLALAVGSGILLLVSGVFAITHYRHLFIFYLKRRGWGVKQKNA